MALVMLRDWCRWMGANAQRSLLLLGIPEDCGEDEFQEAVRASLWPLGPCRVLGKVFRKELGTRVALVEFSDYLNRSMIPQQIPGKGGPWKVVYLPQVPDAELQGRVVMTTQPQGREVASRAGETGAAGEVGAGAAAEAVAAVEAGAPDEVGDSGTAGQVRAAGEAGTAGEEETADEEGTAGVTGAEHVADVAGEAGAASGMGLENVAGAAGERKAEHVREAVGETGAPVKVEVAGEAGVPGETGPTGEEGAEKVTEAAGDAGAPGEVEVEGEAGDPGEVETASEAGDPGEVEAAGEAGDPGEVEAAGEAGAVGEARVENAAGAVRDAGYEAVAAMLGLAAALGEAGDEAEAEAEAWAQQWRNALQPMLESLGYQELRPFSGREELGPEEQPFEAWLEHAYDMLHLWRHVSEREKRRRLVECLSSPALDLLYGLLAEDPSLPAQDCLVAMVQVFGTQDTHMTARIKFLTCTQQPGETLFDFVMRQEGLLQTAMEKGAVHPAVADQVRLRQVLTRGRPNVTLYNKLRHMRMEGQPPGFVGLLRLVRETEAWEAAQARRDQSQTEERVTPAYEDAKESPANENADQVDPANGGFKEADPAKEDVDQVEQANKDAHLAAMANDSVAQTALATEDATKTATAVDKAGATDTAAPGIDHEESTPAPVQVGSAPGVGPGGTGCGHEGLVQAGDPEAMEAEAAAAEVPGERLQPILEEPENEGKAGDASLPESSECSSSDQ
ncbi:paraneoplastic antigen Ma6F-like [Echinops telfairi]|uniref:Paraneoplastic antigen Ma6F-like n=1 Tax=Echinops telfairi TaxID=9371 RepID=A0ABM1VNL9_ECHTE|nr:paraneoplastic antigen Ma6F-like [Echinops telfairi]